MRSKILWGSGLLLVLGVTVAAYGFTVGSARSDCPGKIVCPLLGKLVCRDECPLGAGKAKAAAESDLRPCCRGKK